MSDISTIVREYYDRAADPVTAAEILNSVPVATETPRRIFVPVPNWAFAAAVAVVAVIAISAASLLLGGSDGSGVPVAPTDTTTVTDPPVPDASSVGALPEFAWVSHRLAGGTDREFSNLVVHEGRFVSLIHTGPQRVVAQSPDAVDWTPLESQPTGPYRLFTHEGDLFALTARPTARPTVVERLDSATGVWVPVPIERESELAWTFGVAVAGGEVGAAIIGQSALGEPLMWLLADGVFVPVPDPIVGIYLTSDPASGSEGSIADQTTLHALEDRFVLELEPDPGPRLLRFTSRDGLQWTRVEGLHPLRSSVWDYASSNGRLAAMTLSGVVVSDDEGRTWHETESEQGILLTASPLGWAYVPGQLGVWFDPVQGVAMSADARDWQTGLEAPAAVMGIIARGDQLVVIGSAAYHRTSQELVTSSHWDGLRYEYAPTVWIGTALDPEGEEAPVNSDNASASETPASTWLNNRWGVMLSVTPPILDATPGTYEVTVHGFRSGERGSVWVTTCPGARGVADADTWQPSENLTVVCDLGEDHTFEHATFTSGTFETTLTVTVDDTAIGDGGIVIITGDIWVPVAGTVLLRIADEPGTPWEHGRDSIAITRLTSVISYWPPFVDNYNTTYDELDNCTAAYATAQSGQRDYLAALDGWDESERPSPGYQYDRAVAQLMAAERWLHDNTCPGRYDFTSVG